MLKNVIVAFMLVLIFNSPKVSACTKQSYELIFDPQGLPQINIRIGDESYLALVDLGSSEVIHLSSNILNNIKDKNKTGNTARSTNILGKVSEVDEYTIKTLSIDCIFNEKNTTVLELVPWDASIGETNQSIEVYDAIIGRGFFENYVTIINFSEKSLTLHTNETYEQSSPIENAIPLSVTNNGIEIEVQSKRNTYSLVLDSGASSSILSSFKVSDETESLKNCDFNLGPNIECIMLNGALTINTHEVARYVLLIPIDQRFTADGILGGDFFSNYEIVLDLANKKLSFSN